MDERKQDLCKYRLQQACETLIVAKECYENKHFKDSINRSYYAAFYSIKSVLALGTIDFKRHKDVISYFNKDFVASGIFPREIGKGLGRLQQKREKSDYDDFYIASAEETVEQLEIAEATISAIKDYLSKEQI
ncbi:MAG: HEPN domain-containing protein [Lachnospiraceae bacterium]|nr:HEPN domain-containing protein [Lachnospiraceae bacterium]